MRVLVALDESPISRRAAKEAARLFPGAEFLVVNVGRTVAPWVMAGEFGAVYPIDYVELDTIGLDSHELATEAEEVGLGDADVLTLEGDPAQVICEAAEEHDVDAVVVGSHDKGVWRRLLEPSVAHAVIQGTYRPVVVVSGAPPAAA